MPHELIYTSAPRGLKPGATGYCTVAHTPDLPKDLAEQLEGISHFRHLHVGEDPARTGNPVSFAHSILTTGYTVHHVLSRIADSGLDHSGRSNFLAHHVVFDPDHLPDAGPAWLCEQRLFVQKWDRSPQLIPDDRAIPSGDSRPRPCRKWEQLAGDAGWGGVLASATNAAEPAYIIFEPGQDVLGLLAESMALLSPEARWNVTFSTYFTGKAVRTTCQWRCVTADSVEAREALASRRGVVLRLDRSMGEPDGPLVDAARTGQVDMPAPLRRAASPVVRTPQPAPSPLNLPESEPFVPSTRPVRTRPPEPPPEPDESSCEMPAVAALPSGKGSVGPLLLGILLGGLLVLAFTSLVELAAGKSILGHLNMSPGLQEAKADLEKAKSEQDRLAKDLTVKADELEKEKARSQDERRRSGEKYTTLRDEHDKLQGENDKLKNEFDQLKKAHANAASQNGPLFLGQHEFLIRLLNSLAQQPKKEPKNPVEPMPAQIVRSVSIGDLDLTLRGMQNAREILSVPLTPDQKPKLRMLGLAGSGLTASAKGDDVEITGEGMVATLRIDEKGSLTISGMISDDHPLLGLGVIEVENTASGTIYRQLSKAYEGRVKLADGVLVEGPNTTRFALDMLPEKLVSRVLNDSQIRELRKRRDSKAPLNLALGTHAVVQVGDKEYDLHPPPNWDSKKPPDRLQSKLKVNDVPKVVLKIEGGRLLVDLAPGEIARPNTCRLHKIEVVRLIEELPGTVQELYRAR